MKLAYITDDFSRRDFLRRSGAVASAATGGGPMGLLNMMAGGSKIPFAGISDDELVSTPETEWIGKIPHARLLKIFNDNPDNYIGAELFNKLATVAKYGPNKNQCSNVAKIMTKLAKQVGHNPSELLSDFLQYMDPYTITYCFFGDISLPTPDIKSFRSMREVVKNLNDHGIEASPELRRTLSKNMHEALKEVETRQKEQEEQGPEEQETQKPPQWKPEPQASSMHQWFEQKLLQALSAIT